MAEHMSDDFYYRGQSGSDIWFNSLSFLLDRLTGVFMELFPMKRTGAQIRKVLREQIKLEYETLAGAEREGGWKAVKDSRVRVGLLEKTMDEMKGAVDEYAALKGIEGVRFLMGYWRQKVENEVLKCVGDEKDEKRRRMFISEFVRKETTAARRALRELSEEMFARGKVLENGKSQRLCLRCGKLTNGVNRQDCIPGGHFYGQFLTIRYKWRSRLLSWT